MDQEYIYELIEKANDGDAEAAKELARRYREGDGVEADEQEAEVWEDQLRAINEYNTDTEEYYSDSASHEFYPEIHWYGIEELSDKSNGEIKKEADNGNPFAKSLMSKRYLKSPNRQERAYGIKLLEEANKIGNENYASDERLHSVIVDNYITLGIYYEREGEPLKAFNCYSSAAELEPVYSGMVARCCEAGIGCNPDADRADKLFERAAMAGGAVQKFEYAEFLRRNGLIIRAEDEYSAALASKDISDHSIVASICRSRLERRPISDDRELLSLADGADGFAAYYLSYELPAGRMAPLLKKASKGNDIYAIMCEKRFAEIETVEFEEKLEARRREFREFENDLMEKKDTQKDNEARKTAEIDTLQNREVEALKKRLRAAKRARVVRTILTLIVAVALTLVLGLTLKNERDRNGAASQVIAAIEAGEYDDARSIYNSEVKGKGAQARVLDRFITQKIESDKEAYTDGDLSFSNYINVLEVLRDVSSESVSKKVEDIISSASVFDSGISALREGDYLSAIETLSEIEKDDFFFSEAKDAIQMAQDLYASEVVSGIGIKPGEEDPGKYYDAFSAISVALEIAPNSTELKEKLLELCDAYRETVPQMTESVAQNLKTSSAALEALNKAISIFPDDDALQNRLNSVTDVYADLLESSAAELKENGDRRGAWELVKMAKEALPDNRSIDTLYESFRGYAPSEMNIVSSEKYYGYSGQIKSTYGNVYSEGTYLYFYWMWMDTGVGSVKIYTDGKFSLMEGVTGIEAGEDNESAGFEVYNENDELLYRSIEFDGSTLPDNFSVDISGTKTITIKVYKTGYDSVGVILGDLLFYK